MGFGRKVPAVAIIASMLLTGCVTSQGSAGTDAGLTPDQRALRDYTAEYTGTGAVAGAVAGCAIGALVARNRGSGCLAGAAAGGALGAGGGYYLAQRQKEVGTQGTTLAADRAELDREIAEIQNQITLTERVTRQTQQEVETLSRKVASGQASREQMEARLRIAREDQKAMLAVQKRLQGNIDQIERDIRERRGSKQDIEQLKSKLTLLKEKDQSLRKDIDAMSGITQSLVS